MSYTPTTWSSGDLITSAKLNKIEQGLANTSELDSAVTEIEGEVTELKNDLTTAENAINAAQSEIETLRDTAYIVNTASGDIAAFSDGAAANVEALTVNVEPIQDLHGYDSTWPAGGGVNICDSTKFTGYGQPYGLSFAPTEKGFRAYGTVSSGVDRSQHSFRAVSINDDSIDLSVAKIAIFNAPSGVSARFDTGSRTIALDGLVFGTGDVIDVEFYVVIYLGSTAPTSWTPYSNICPISGRTSATVYRTGENLLNPVGVSSRAPSIVGLNIEWDLSGYVHLHGTYTGPDKASEQINILSVNPDLTSFNIIGFSDSPNFTSLRWQAGASQIVVRLANVVNNTNYDIIIYPMVYAGTAPLAYEPYTGTTIPISWETEAGTVCGGTVDVISGKLTVNRAMQVYDGSEDEIWSYYSISTGNLFRTITDRKSETITALSNKAKYLCNSYTVAGNESTGRTTGHFSGANKNVDFVNNNFTTVESWRINLANHPLQFMFPLADPVTYQLTPQQVQTLLGDNVVWSDAGSVSVDYRADTKLYIEQLTKPTEDDMTANTAIQSGKFFMIGNRLFLSTAAIASGDTINPGTNCTELSLADALNNLN